MLTENEINEMVDETLYRIRKLLNDRLDSYCDKECILVCKKEEKENKNKCIIRNFIRYVKLDIDNIDNIDK